MLFIPQDQSCWKFAPQVSDDKRFGVNPVGVLSNGKNTIEIFFLHYHSEQEVRDKWERRIQRFNWDKLLFKFNDQNGCTLKVVGEFMKLPYKHKLFFTCKHYANENSKYTVIHQFLRNRRSSAFIKRYCSLMI